MASLSVRKISDATVAALRARAAKAGVSMEEEVRRILDEAASAEEGLGTAMVRIFSRSWDGESFVPPARTEFAEPITFRDEE